MTEFTVKEVIDGDTFKVKGGWKWEGQSGDIIRPMGYNTPEEGQLGYQVAKEKLTKLILGKVVDVKYGKTIDRGRLVADVSYNGKNLAEYFPNYKK
jgi:endonuclease YncB( thermonuclease family)